MSAFRRGKVVQIFERRRELVKMRVALDDSEIVASGFTSMLGPVAAGDAVIVNTTGLDLGLGTGGEGFVLWNLDGNELEADLPGHVLKLRYTPWQKSVLAVEAPESPYHATLRTVRSLERAPVVVCSLHSQVAGVVAGAKASRPDMRVGYLMTDAAALPLEWSDLVSRLQEASLLDMTCTAGHAFGGDFESVNVYSGLLALRHAGKCDLIVAAMGPGVVGTGTALGFTGMEQGHILDAATTLEGRSHACVRISFADERSRHRGISHHNLTALALGAREPATIVIPALPDGKLEVLEAQLARTTGLDRHTVVMGDGDPGVRLLASKGIEPSSMGRPLSQAPEVFLAAAAAGQVAASG